MRVKIEQTSSRSCSAGAGGVLGREGAIDSAARRTIMESEGVREREGGVFRPTFSGRRSHAVPERNRVFLDLKHRLHFALEIQAIGQ